MLMALDSVLKCRHPWWPWEGRNGGWFCKNIMNSLQRYNVGGPCQKDIPSNRDRSINGKACSIRLLPLRVRTTRHVPNPWKSDVIKTQPTHYDSPPYTKCAWSHSWQIWRLTTNTRAGRRCCYWFRCWRRCLGHNRMLCTDQTYWCI